MPAVPTTLQVRIDLSYVVDEHYLYAPGRTAMWPAQLARMALPEMSPTPLVSFEGAAELYAPSSLKRLYGSREQQWVRIGSDVLGLVRTQIPGAAADPETLWVDGMALCPGAQYKVEVFECMMPFGESLPLERCAGHDWSMHFVQSASLAGRTAVRDRRKKLSSGVVAATSMWTLEDLREPELALPADAPLAIVVTRLQGLCSSAVVGPSPSTEEPQGALNEA